MPQLKTLILSNLDGGEVILHNNSFCRKIPKGDPSDLLLNTLNFFFLSLISYPFGSTILHTHRDMAENIILVIFFVLHASQISVTNMPDMISNISLSLQTSYMQHTQTITPYHTI